MSLKFPISQKEGKSYTTEELFGLLAKETSGHYLLGNHNFWHGGIHFTGTNVSQCIKEQAVGCIADGEVIAYRINDKYPISHYTENNEVKIPYKSNILDLHYSTSFCLVKHTHTSEKRKEEPKETKPSWNNRYFILQEERNVRDAATGSDSNKEKPITYKGTLPNKSKIQIVSLEKEAEGKYTIAQVRIIAFGDKTTALPNKIGTTKEQKAITKAVGDTAYIAVFDSKGNIDVNSKKQPYLTEYTPQQTWVGKTLVLNTEVKGSLSKLNFGAITDLGLDTHTSEVAKELMSPPLNRTVATQSQNPEQLKYIATLPKGLQVKVISCNQTTAAIQLTRPVKATLENPLLQIQNPKDIDVNAGEQVIITLFKADHETIETYEAIPAKDKIPAQQAPIAKTTTTPEDWQGQIITLTKEMDATCDIEEPHKKSLTFKLPVDTKLRLQTTEPSSIDTLDRNTYTQAELQHDIIVNLDDTQTFTFYKGRIFNINLFDYYGNLKTDPTKTDNADPLTNPLVYYSLYMHLMATEEYTQDQTFPSYIKGKITGRVTIKGLEVYNDDATKTKSKMIIIDGGVIEYDPSNTTTISITDAKNNTTQKTLTYCKFISGDFKDKLTLTINQQFWAEINSTHVKAVKLTPTNPNKINLCKNTPIKAGDPIGYLGLYQIPVPKGTPLVLKPDATANQTTTKDPITGLPSVPQILRNMINEQKIPAMMVQSKSQLHLEIFVNDQRQLKNFIENKAKLQTGKQYLKLTPGAIIVQNKQITPPKKGETPPKETNYSLTEQHILELSKLKTYQETDGEKNLWYEIEVTDNEQTITGHIKQKADNSKQLSQHDWQELGFTMVEETKENADGYVEYDNITGFFKTLFDKLDTKKKDQQLDKDELEKTLTDPKIRDQWSKLIGNHPSEWYYTDTKWQRLDTILANNKQLLEHEKERIKALSFWNEIPELNPHTRVCHIHPVAFLEHMVATNLGIYHIYSTGKIIKENCSVDNTHLSYYYYDASNNKHIISENIEIIKIKKRVSGKNINYTQGTIQTHQKNLEEPCAEGTITERKIYANADEHIYIKATSSGVNLEQRVICANEDIYEYGKEGEGNNRKWVFYAKEIPEVKALMLRMPVLNYSKDNITVNYDFHGTERKYTNPDTFAGFIGVLAEIGFSLQSAGSSFISGSSFPSLAHTNGASIDTAYLWNKTKDQSVINAALKFHFKQIIAGAKTKIVTVNKGKPNERKETQITYFNSLTSCHSYKSDHNGHLHFGNIKIPELK